MKLYFDSFTARLYRWFYMTDQMPLNLCPYFWKCVIMYVFIVPYTIFTIPTYIKCVKVIIHSPLERFVASVILWMLLSVVLCILFTLCTCWISTFWTKYWPIYIEVFVLIAIIGFPILYSELSDKKFESIIIAFIKAKYHKYCPKITWK